MFNCFIFTSRIAEKNVHSLILLLLKVNMLIATRVLFMDVFVNTDGFLESID
jgi:hypothetical protein